MNGVLHSELNIAKSQRPKAQSKLALLVNEMSTNLNNPTDNDMPISEFNFWGMKDHEMTYLGFKVYIRVSKTKKCQNRATLLVESKILDMRSYIRVHG